MKVHQRYSSGSVLFAGLLFCFLLAGLQPTSAANTSSDTFAIIKVKKRLAAELLPQVQTVLSPTGRASADTISNAIIVSDSPEIVQHIRQLIVRLDIPVPQVTLHLRYRQAATKTRSLSTAGGISGSKGGLRMHTDTYSQSNNLRLTVSSGKSGYLMVGRDIAFTTSWLDLCARYGYRFTWMTEYRRIESGFEVRPVVRGPRVELTLLPRISFGDRREIRFTEAATQITIPVDTWVQVAASDVGTQSVSAAILTANGQTNSQAMVLEVLARVRN